MKRTKTVRSMAAGLAAAMAFAGLGMGVALTANAVDVANPNKIESTAKGSIKVHKLTPATSNTDAPNDGSALDVATKLPGAKAISGITFTATKVKDIDLTTNAGWKKANELANTFTGSLKETQLENTVTKTAVTTTTGLADLTELPVGLYYVTETIPAGATGVAVQGNPNPGEAGYVDPTKLVPVKPFLVTVPMTNPANNNAWMYDINVYPKNQPTDLTKTVDESAGNLIGKNGGTDLGVKNVNSYTITYGLPGVFKEYKQFYLVDRFKTAQMTWKDAAEDNEVYLVNATGEKITDPKLEKDTHYTFVKGAEGDDTYVTVVFTEAGRKKLIEARDNNGAAKVAWTLKTEITAANADLVEIKNQTFPIPTDPNQPGGDFKPGEPKKDDLPDPEKPIEVSSKYGTIEITKLSTDRTKGAKKDGKLAGAEFDIYTCTKDTAADSYTLNKKLNADGKPITTNAEGIARVEGLLLLDWDGTKVVPAGNKYYCLVETKAPVGHERAVEPIHFQLTTENSTEAKPAFEKEIENVPSNGGFELPITGGNGIVLIVISGGLLVAGSLFYAISSARKNRKES